MRGSRAARTVAVAGLIAALGLPAGGCAITHHARTIGAKNVAANLSLGGPLQKDVGPAPLPLVVGHVTYGVRDLTDVHAGLNLLLLPMGVVGLDLGATQMLLDGQGPVPSISVTGRLNLFAGRIGDAKHRSEAYAAPQLDLTVSWLLARRALLYVGINDFIQIVPFRWLAAPFAGAEIRVCKHVGLGVEAKWLVPYRNSLDAVPEYITAGDAGVISILFGVTYYMKEPR